MIVPPRRSAVGAGALLVGLALAGCGAPDPSPTGPPKVSVPAPAGPDAAGTAGATDAPTGSAPGPAPVASVEPSRPVDPAPPVEPPAAPVALPWPPPGDAAGLQATVDGGSQPWLLDPSELALAYVAAAHGWTDAQAYPGPGGTSVDVRNAAGDRVTLSLAQPGRRGEGGIWVVTGEDPA